MPRKKTKDDKEKVAVAKEKASVAKEKVSVVQEKEVVAEEKKFKQYKLETGRTVMGEREVNVNGAELIELSLSDGTRELHSAEELKKLK